MKTEEKVKCPYEKKCGGCKYQGIPYEKQLKEKEKKVRKLLKDYGKPEPILGMEDPYYYRNKVHAAFGRDRKGNVISGCSLRNRYHWDHCFQKCQRRHWCGAEP